MPKIKMLCDYCGAVFYKYKSCKTGKHKFCCCGCSAKFKTKALNPDGYTKHQHLSTYNREHNKERMTPEVRQKLSNSKFGRGKQVGYAKRRGRHEHRLIMEWMLGRALRKGEVVHRIDFNKRNNNPENLMLFPSQAAHAAYHQLIEKRGDAF